MKTSQKVLGSNTNVRSVPVSIPDKMPHHYLLINDLDPQSLRLSVLIWTCLQLLQVSGETDPIVELENVAGKLIFYQNEGNSTCVRDTGELASAVQTVAMFEIFDPEQTLGQTELTYTWDFGNGEVITGTDPVVLYNYTESGNYTLRLQVGANKTQQEIPIAGVYSMDVKVLDVIRNIEMKGPSSYQVAENVSMVFHVDGSPPMWVCWQVVPDCKSVPPVGCTLSVLYSNTLRLDHTFTSTGVHCLNINARNDISALHTSYSVYVGRDPYSNLFFIMSCLAVLAVTFAFIAVIACRPRRPRLLTVRLQIRSRVNGFIRKCTVFKTRWLSYSAIFLNGEEEADMSNGLERGESQPLIPHHDPRYT
ncbi:Transmembrane protein 130 [Merluccius polli]|uniref:Transmembrane protein 130 n=1 Tax=Merluccius polli TaxID=89951 RepID=A0AA47P988_MERPO|nr:Transmembrane protein 130 [Merluccius polli]